MIDNDLLLWVCLVELVIFVSLLLLLMARSIVPAVRGPRQKRQLQVAETELIQALESGKMAPYSFWCLNPAHQVEAMFELAPSVSGQRRADLAVMALETGLTGRARRWTQSDRWSRRIRGAELLRILGESGPVTELLHDPRPEVRIRTAEWATVEPSRKVVEELCSCLSDPNPGVRFATMDSLLRIGGAAVGPLSTLIGEASDPMTLIAGLRVAGGIGDPRLVSLAENRCRDRHPGVRAAAAAACGNLGGEVASATLRGLMSDPEPRVRVEAVTALGRNNHWPSAPDIAPLLEDPEWTVRKAAAIALGQLGAIGSTYLRRIARGDDALASRVARQALGSGATSQGRN